MLESGAWWNNLVEIGSVRAYDVDRLRLELVRVGRFDDATESDLLTVRRKDRLDVEPSAGDLTRV